MGKRSPPRAAAAAAAARVSPPPPPPARPHPPAGRAGAPQPEHTASFRKEHSRGSVLLPVSAGTPTPPRSGAGRGAFPRSPGTASGLRGHRRPPPGAARPGLALLCRSPGASPARAFPAAAAGRGAGAGAPPSLGRLYRGSGGRAAGWRGALR